MIKVTKDKLGNVRISVVNSFSAPMNPHDLLIPRVEYENFLRGVFNGEYDYSLLEEE